MSELNNCFKEAVCVEVSRVFDSCSDRDCIYELPVTLTAASAPITDDMDVVRTRCVEVEATCISVDSVPFKAGYYSVDVTYRFLITAEAYTKGCCKPLSGTLLCGTALWNKRVILYGGVGSSKVFSSDMDLCTTAPTSCDSNFANCSKTSTMPTATVRVVDPIALDTKFICVPANAPAPGICQPDFKPCCPTSCCQPCFPPHIMNDSDGSEMMPPPPFPPRPEYRRILTVSLGLFSIVQLSRPVSIVIPAYDYCIPCKDCSTTSSSEAPCDVFDRIAFPADQFFPQPGSDAAKYSSCCAPAADSANAEAANTSSNKCNCSG